MIIYPPGSGILSVMGLPGSMPGASISDIKLLITASGNFIVTDGGSHIIVK